MTSPRVHHLKTWPSYFAAVVDGRKRFELRTNDRDFRQGDVLVLQEFDPIFGSLTGVETTVAVDYVSGCRPFLPEGMVCMTISPLPSGAELARIEWCLESEKALAAGDDAKLRELQGWDV